MSKINAVRTLCFFCSKIDFRDSKALKKAVLTFEGGGIMEEISCVTVLRKEDDLERKNCKPERNLFTAVPYFYYAEGFLLSILKEP